MRSVLALVIVLSGCATQRAAKVAHAYQPNPLAALGSPDELPVSDRLYIFQSPPSTIGGTSKLHRPRPLLRSWAEFAVVSRDRLRFHVGITRFEEENADTRAWRAWLEDDRGRRLSPVAREVARMDRYGGWIDARSAYVGTADFVFYERDLVSRDTRGVSLVLAKGDEVYRFEWEFDEGRWVQHYGYRELDRQMKTVVIPPLGARPLASRWEVDGD